MSLADAHRRLASLVETFAAAGLVVEDARLQEDGLAGDEFAEVRLAVAIPLDEHIGLSANPGSDPQSIYGDETIDDLPHNGTKTDDGDDSDETADETPTFECPNCEFVTDDETGLSIHRAKAHADDSDPVWCGICGAGPFETRSQLGGHHAGAGHDGDTDPVDGPDAGADEDSGDPPPDSRVRRGRTTVARRSVLVGGGRDGQ